ncbi:MAG: peptidoglycan DL-endopeptidase LytF [Chloroflexota bacterium]|nr:peptidoglycan DL-endopeptidase LytF [Chloroflexota bacterium]
MAENSLLRPTHGTRPAHYTIRQLFESLPEIRGPQLLGALGAALGIVLVAMLAFAFRAPTAATVAPAEPVDTLTYSPDELRPALEAATDTAVPMPAIYTVEEGDTLVGIAYRFGTAVEAIRVASRLDDIDMLSLGQMLVVPPAASRLQTVESALTIQEVADEFGVDAGIVAAYNGRPIEMVDEPIAAEVVVLPVTAADTANRVAASARGAQPAADDTTALTTTYTVAEGDTVLSIANKLGVDSDALVAANRLGDSNMIITGDQLAVPVWARPAVNAESATGTVASVQTAEATDDGQGAAAEGPFRLQAPIAYQVEVGDTIAGLAARFGVDTDTIALVNDIPNADQIGVGDVLEILPVSGVLYTVEQGDTLADIAALYKIDLGPVIDFNYLDDADYLVAGKELILPGAHPLPPAPPRATGPTTYVVQPGDTVVGIARKFGVDAVDITAANGMRSADVISIGDELKIVPGAGERAAAAGPARTAPAQAAAPKPVQAQQQVTRNLPVPQPASAPAVSSSAPGAGGGIVSFAMNYLGYRYVFGGTTPAGFDCSGFVYYVMNQTGHGISRGMWGQYEAGSHPSKANLQPGDIVFFANTYMAGLSHNGIYIGNGKFIHAADERTGVVISDLNSSYYVQHYYGATRR